jgi:hypothetical protein
VRISWLEPSVVRLARAALSAHRERWSEHFTPRFEAPPAPVELDQAAWPHIAEHVARAERVSTVVRENGLEAALAAFGGSSHAVELATLIAASVEIDAPDLVLVEALLQVDIDELVIYGSFLTLLVQLTDDSQLGRAIDLYERFVSAAQAKVTADPSWPERVRVARDGLAGLYVRAGRFENADLLFAVRHDEDRGDVAVALSASRAFLAAGEVARAVHWLGVGAERAGALQRTDMAELLRKKQDTLRKRLN